MLSIIFNAFPSLLI